MPNYTGIFFPDGKHATWQYGYPLRYPEGVKAGDDATVTVIGKYKDEQVGCWVIRWEDKTNKPEGTLLHITTFCKGASPVESGKRATKSGFESVEEFELKGEWK